MSGAYHDITFFEFEVFVALSQLRSIRAAARKLKLKPSHVSKIAQRLERKSGKTLLRRASTGVFLTREGSAFQNYASQVLAFSDSLLEGEDQKTKIPAPARVMIFGGPSFLNRTALTEALARLRNLDNSYRFRVLDMPPDQLPPAALKGAFDIVIHTDKEPWTKAWDVTLVGEMSWGLFGRRAHPLGVRATLKEVVAYPFVVPTYWEDNQYVIGNDLFPVPWDERVRGDEASTADTAAHMVAVSDQVAFLPMSRGRSAGSGAQIARIDISDMKPVTRKVYLIVKADSVSAVFRKKLLNALKESL